jgi:hypothetical protein
MPYTYLQSIWIAETSMGLYLQEINDTHKVFILSGQPLDNGYAVVPINDIGPRNPQTDTPWVLDDGER